MNSFTEIKYGIAATVLEAPSNIRGGATKVADVLRSRTGKIAMATLATIPTAVTTGVVLAPQAAYAAPAPEDQRSTTTEADASTSSTEVDGSTSSTEADNSSTSSTEADASTSSTEVTQTTEAEKPEATVKSFTAFIDSKVTAGNGNGKADFGDFFAHQYNETEEDAKEVEEYYVGKLQTAGIEDLSATERAELYKNNPDAKKIVEMYKLRLKEGVKGSSYYEDLIIEDDSETTTDSESTQDTTETEAEKKQKAQEEVFTKNLKAIEDKIKAENPDWDEAKVKEEALKEVTPFLEKVVERQAAKEKLYIDSVNKIAKQVAEENPDLDVIEVQREAEKRLNNFLEKLAASSESKTAEVTLQKEISKEVEAQLNKIGLDKKDVTIVSDPKAELPGPRETGANSFNHGKAPVTAEEGMAQSLDILNARNGFTKADQAVAVNALRVAGLDDETILKIAAGEITPKISLFTLNSSSAEYINIAFNSNGELKVDNLRAVNEKDGFVIVEVEVDGKIVTYQGRFDCSGSLGLQIFEKFEVDQPAPEAPSRPEVPGTPAKPIAETFKAQYCTGLDEKNQPVYAEVFGYATQEEANEAAAAKEKECEVVDTTTTTTTSAPTTTSTTGVTTTTTSAPTTSTSAVVSTTKVCENNPVSCESTTVPPTITETTQPSETQPPATVAGNIASAATFGAMGSQETGSQTSLGLYGALSIAGLGKWLRRRRRNMKQPVGQSF